MQSAWEKVKVDDGSMGLYVSVPEGPGPFPAVVVLQHRDGVDEFVQEMTRRLASERFVAVGPELYHRDGPDCQDNGQTRARRIQDANIIKDVNSALGYLKEHRTVQPGRVGIVGFCQGGRGSYLMAGVSPSLKAAVCPILGHFGEDDENPSPEDVRKLDTELTKYNKAHEFFSYQGAGHAFMNFAASSFRPDAAQTSWPRTLDFLKKHV